MLQVLNLPLVFLLLVNLIPIWGVFYFDWDAAAILLIYWAENLIIGGYNILKMLTVHPVTPGAVGSRLFIVLFFMLHYGGFTAVHGLFLMEFLNISDSSDTMKDMGETWPVFLVFLQMLVQVVNKMWATMPAGMLWPLIALVLSHGVSYAYHFILGGESRRVRVKSLMAQPYGRIVIMHITLLAGGALVTQFGSPVGLLLVLIIVKIIMDVAFHLRQHRKLKAQPEN